MDSINTNYSSSYPIAFQAYFKSEIPIQCAEKLSEVVKGFRIATNHNPKDTMTLVPFDKPEVSDFIGYLMLNKPDSGTCKYKHTIYDFNSLLEQRSVKDIVEKLVNYFKTMKKEEEFDKLTEKMNKEIESLTDVHIDNMRTAQTFEQEGNIKFANRYKVIAKSNLDKINELKAKLAAEQNKIIEKIREFSNKEPEIRGIADSYCKLVEK